MPPGAARSTTSSEEFTFLDFYLPPGPHGERDAEMLGSAFRTSVPMLQLSRPTRAPVRPTDDLRITGVTFDTGSVRITLTNRRTFELDLHRYPPLLNATFEERMGWMLVDGGHGLAWPALGLGSHAVEGLINSRHLVRQTFPPRLAGAPAVGVS